MIPFYWDPGFLTTNSSGLFDRNTGSQGYHDVIAAIVSAAPPPVVSVLHQTRTTPMRLVHSGDLLMSEGGAEISLFNLNGKLVRGSTFNGEKAVLSLTGLQAGLYVARIGSRAVSILAR